VIGYTLTELLIDLLFNFQILLKREISWWKVP